MCFIGRKIAVLKKLQIITYIGGRLPTVKAATNRITNITIKMKNKILAISALATATPVKPNMPAMIEIMRNTRAQRNITDPPLLCVAFKFYFKLLYCHYNPLMSHRSEELNP